MNALSQKTDTLTEDVLDIVARFGEEESSLSFVRQELKAKGWSGFGNNSRFETTLESLGFTLKRVYTKGSSNIRATYVTVV